MDKRRYRYIQYNPAAVRIIFKLLIIWNYFDQMTTVYGLLLYICYIGELDVECQFVEYYNISFHYLIHSNLIILHFLIYIFVISLVTTFLIHRLLRMCYTVYIVILCKRFIYYSKFKSLSSLTMFFLGITCTSDISTEAFCC